MPQVDTRTNTVHLTDDEFSALRERVQVGEIGRVLAEAQPSADPQVVVPETEPDENGFAMTLPPVVYSYAITIPPGDLVTVRDALVAEGHADTAAALAGAGA